MVYISNIPLRADSLSDAGDSKKTPPALFNITPSVEWHVSESGVRNGVAVVQSLHTTLGIAVNEWESGLRADFLETLSISAPDGAYYEHDDESVRTENLECGSERKNGEAHCRALLIPTSVSIIVEDGRLSLGKWQSVIAFDFDPRHSSRTFKICVMGER